MEVTRDMVTFPRVAPPAIVYLENHEESAIGLGTARFGVTSLTAHCLVVVSDHAGTHIDAMRHVVPDAPGAEGIPLEYCFGDGVVLDFRDKEFGHEITVEDLQRSLDAIGYVLKPLDIVLIMTGADKWNTTKNYLTDHCGMTREATIWLLDRGIKVIGIDAITFDPPIWSMFDRGRYWEAHRVMWEREYYHVENLVNLDAIPRPHGFKVSMLPIKWKGATAAPVRAVAIVEE